MTPWTVTQQTLVAQMVKNLPAVEETRVQSLGWEDPLEKGMATHASIVAWRTPWTEEPGGLQSMGLHSWTQLSDSHFHIHDNKNEKMQALVYGSRLCLLHQTAVSMETKFQKQELCL